MKTTNIKLIILLLSLLPLGAKRISTTTNVTKDLEINGENSKPILLSSSTNAKTDCVEYLSECGTGHDNGYTENYYSTGCRCWSKLSYHTSYDKKTIPYWINVDSVSRIARSEQDKNDFINEVEYQANLRNKCFLNSEASNIASFKRIDQEYTNKPTYYNGIKVIEILAKENVTYDGQNYAGLFWGNKLLIEISFNYDEYNFGRSKSTILHELGHALGLDDLDYTSGNRNHKVLMGYDRSYCSSNIDDAITHHDIVGVAVANNIHTVHDFKRHFTKAGNIYDVCFVCDKIEKNVSKTSSYFIDSTYCTHSYEEIATLGDKFWKKCTRCYKVYAHRHEYKYEWVNYKQHKVTCSCGYNVLYGHTLSGPLLPGKKGICTYCKGTAEQGFIITP